MNLGTEECVEVWFMPTNVTAYLPRKITECSSVDAAREYVKAEADKYAGSLEMVRVTLTRQWVA
jgi:hypothetical protein